MVDPGPVIQATLAPAFLISGASIFLNFTQTRLFRVVDRIRAMREGASEDERLEHSEQRARLLRNAIAIGVLTVFLTVLTAILLMASAMAARPRLAQGAPYVFAMAMISLLVALVLVLYDTVLSVRGVTGRR